ncbi:MAG: 2TM domain-containing protein [Acidimicrobiia bacterium]
MADTATRTPEARAQRRAEYLSGLLWHAGTYVIVNAFLWALDLMGGSGVQWSLWVTLGWGLALAFHALAYFVDGRGLEERKAQEYLADEHERTARLQ